MLLLLWWLEEPRLGRKRLLDTMLASTLQAGGVTSLLTLNGRLHFVWRLRVPEMT
jgi:hypothetical protein